MADFYGDEAKKNSNWPDSKYITGCTNKNGKIDAKGNDVAQPDVGGTCVRTKKRSQPTL